MTAPAVIPIALGYNTVYALPTAGGVILIDAGPDYEGAWESLTHQLAAHGLAAADVRFVCLTHGHADHAGLGRRWQETGAVVVAGAGDAFALCQGTEELQTYRRHVLRCLETHGAPPDRLEALRAHWRRSTPRDDEEAPDTRREPAPRWPGPLRITPFTPDRLVGGEERLSLGDVSLRVLPCPGHTPGTLVYVHQEAGIAFTGDHLLPGVTPSPGLQFLENRAAQRYRALPDFRRSLEAMTALAPRTAYPGHGEPFTNVEAAATRTLRRQEARANRILRILQAGEASAFDLVQRFFPRLPARYLSYVIGEVLGVLDWLEQEGRVQARNEESPVRYRLACE